MSNLYHLQESKIYINLNALAGNLKRLKAKCSPDAALMAVVKANGYGHGAVEVAKTALKNGASYLAVARIHEALELRESGIDAPILLFGEVSPSYIESILTNNISITVGSIDSAKAVSKAVENISKNLAYENNKLKPTVKVHIKIDTGMGRLGFLMPQSPRSDNLTIFYKVLDEIVDITKLNGIDVEGIYTHFANADTKDKSHVNEQIERFNNIIDALAERGFKPEICHASNSAAIIDIPDGHFNMVRAGIAMYGLYPSYEIDKSLICLEPVMSVVSKIIHIKNVGAGFRVSYGSTYITKSPTKIATIPIGYADGYSRLLSSKGEMLVRGQRCRVLGRVCMDYTMIDVGHIFDAAVGDEVVVMGKQKDDEISADEIANHINTINYEVVCSLDRRMAVEFIA